MAALPGQEQQLRNQPSFLDPNRSHSETNTLADVEVREKTNTSADKVLAPGDDIPDGGVVAWLQVLGSFFLFFSSWGICNTFGAYQTYYETNLLASQSASDIAWIGSLQPCLTMIVGVLTGPIFDMGYFTTLVSTGTVLVVFGIMMTSISTEYYQVFLAQGVAFGIGSGCLFVPSVAILATYFKRWRSFAVGVAASGSSIGGVIYPAVFRQLLAQVGFAWATRAIGFIALGTLAISLAVMRQRVTPAARRRLIDLPAFKYPPYALFCIGAFIAFAGMYIPFFYISSYALTRTNAGDELSFYFLAILNAASSFGRVLPNLVADYIGPLNMMIPFAFISGVLACGWLGVTSTSGLLAFAVLYGFFSGTYVSLPASTMASLTPDMGRVGTWMGMGFTCGGLGVLIGTPVAGALINLDTGEFWKAQVLCLTLIFASTGFMAASRVAKAGWGLQWA